jgi:hypothetical protein
MNHVYLYEDGTYLPKWGPPVSDIQNAYVGPKASVASKAGSVTASRSWRKLPKLIGKCVPVRIVDVEACTPQAIIDLYERAQIDSDMDCGTYVGGTDTYGVDHILRALAEDCGWTLPARMKLEQRKQWLRDRDRAEEIEYLGVNGD